MGYSIIEGGVTAAQGFSAGGVHCGIRRNQSKLDLALIYSEKECVAAGVYTQNLVKGAPVLVTKQNLADGKAQAIIVNSGNANTCNKDGLAKAVRMSEIAAELLDIPADDVIVASTGVIGQELPIEPIENAAEALLKSLGSDNSSQAACAIMTTDTVKKEAAVTCSIDGKIVTIGGIAKGTGMIHPNMATMLSFVTSDCAISREMLQKAMTKVTGDSFNMVSVDGDSSTNDTFTVMANGLAGNNKITAEGECFNIFCGALMAVCKSLAIQMAADGEGSTKLLICKVINAADVDTAKKVAKSVISSSLLKAAMFGRDANWGRVLCAIGYAGANLDVQKIDVAFASDAGTVEVCKGGFGLDFSEEQALEVLSEKNITIDIDLNSGSAEAEAYGCDLTYDYVKINGDYRT